MSSAVQVWNKRPSNSYPNRNWTAAQTLNGSDPTGCSCCLQYVRHFSQPLSLRDCEDVSTPRSGRPEARFTGETTSRCRRRSGRAVICSSVVASPPGLRLALVRAQRTVALEPLQLVLRGHASHRRINERNYPSAGYWARQCSISSAVGESTGKFRGDWLSEEEESCWPAATRGPILSGHAHDWAWRVRFTSLSGHPHAPHARPVRLTWTDADLWSKDPNGTTVRLLRPVHLCGIFLTRDNYDIPVRVYNYGSTKACLACMIFTLRDSILPLAVWAII